ncbi:S8 family peptidase [Bacillus benzoevorans]|uniref:Subtilisin family serine protease n=1 Tax=Bacillus benzoevorans TaxID=1456 RepID=A0A7X0HVY4_9BACI|nr:subtilisin family serine protease [Bacillus benzoevorans]
MFLSIVIIGCIFVSSSFIFKDKLQQKNLNLDQLTPWGVHKINASVLWTELNKEKIKIAILDSGIDKNHKDLKGVIQGEFNAINLNEPIIDELGHGTAVAGVIAAQNNNIGLIGVSPDVYLYSVKVLDRDGNGSVEDFVKGIEWSINNDVNIINLSFGISKDNFLLEAAINKAISKGIIVVASSGNTYGGEVEYPAAYPKVISVTATEKDNDNASFTSKGKIDFSAPGVDIPILAPNDKYSINSGTSLATPYITGIVSLILRDKEKFNISSNEDIHSQVYDILQSWSKDLGKKGKDEIYGEGLVIIK